MHYYYYLLQLNLSYSGGMVPTTARKLEKSKT